jgi:hypothetical protein
MLHGLETWGVKKDGKSFITRRKNFVARSKESQEAQQKEQHNRKLGKA